MNGWSVAVVGQSNAGLDVQCTRVAATAIAAGEMLLTIQHRATVSRSLTTHVRLARVTLMPGVARYSDCVLASSFDSNGFSEEIDYACPDSTLSKFLRGELALADLQIKPQPANSKVTLSLRAREAGVTQFTIVDVTGREVRRVTENLHPGLNECELDIRGLPSGSYRVSASLPTSYRLWAPLTIAR
jgi:hypothetical protein